MSFLQQIAQHLVVVLLSLAPGQPSSASAVLHAWDQRRAAAWATQDPVALRALYAPDSGAGRADVAMLRAWRERGLRVEGMRMQLVDLAVRRAAPTRLELVVTDRLSAAVAVGRGVRLVLPHDGVTTRRVVLERAGADGRWRVAQASPVRSTSWTERSWKE